MTKPLPQEAELHKDCIKKESVEHHYQEMIKAKANIDRLGIFSQLQMPDNLHGLPTHKSRYKYHRSMYEALSNPPVEETS